MDTTKAKRLSLEVHALIEASIKDAWKLLVDPVRLGRLFWESTVESDFVPGRPIVWRGTWEGKPFEDRGTIKAVKKPSLLQYSHWAPSSGPDIEANHSLLTWRLSAEKKGVHVSFSHENIATEEMKEHSRQMWSQLLARMKEMLEAGARNGSAVPSDQVPSPETASSGPK
jgi:hypothetical protein